MTPEEALKSSDPYMSMPPSRIFKDFLSTNPQPSEEMVDVARTLLPVSEVEIWLNHLQIIENNRKRGAAKAAETRRKKRELSRKDTRQINAYYCGVCGGVYEEETNEVEVWIGCEQCDSWFHATCLGLDPSDPEDIVSM